MKQTLVTTLAALTVLALSMGCGDDDGGNQNQNQPDAALPDAALPDAALPDAALPDAALPDAAPTSAQPPAAGPVFPGDGAGSTTFAIRRLYLGDTDPDGTADPTNGWRSYGYDLDGLQSTAQSVDLCVPRDSASPNQVYPDGDLGRDNAFGKLILPMLLGLMPDWPVGINEVITDGYGTLLITLDALGAGGDYNPLAARLYRAAPLGTTPLWDGSDVWAVASELLQDPPDLASSTMAAPTSYLVGNTWVGQVNGTLELRLETSSGSRLTLPIDQAVVTMDLSGDHATAVRGTIAGVIGTDKLLTRFQDEAGWLDPFLCDTAGPAFQSIAAQLAQASDILRDATQDPASDCDAISIGLGFEAQRAVLGAVASPEVVIDPCP